MYSIADLAQAQRLGAGANRYCVVSPVDSHVCLKIGLPEHQRQVKNWRQRLQRYLSSRFLRFNENYVEWIAYQRLIQRIPQHILHKHIAACIELDQIEHEWILSCELVRDDNDFISLSLDHYLTHGVCIDPVQISKAIDELASWLIQHNIPLFDLNSGNLVVQHTDNGLLLKCIDVKSTWRSKEIIPLSYWSKKMMHRKILRRADRLKNLMTNRLGMGRP